MAERVTGVFSEVYNLGDQPQNILQQAPKSLSRAQRLGLIRKIDRADNTRDYAIVVTALNTGIRLSELVYRA